MDELDPEVSAGMPSRGELAALEIGSRALFPTLAASAYLNHAAISPASTFVRRAAASVTADFAARGSGAFFSWVRQRARLRHDLAALLGADADEVALVPNTTAGVVFIANSLAWSAGDRVVLFDGEFPTNVTPWLAACKTFSTFSTFKTLGVTPEILPMHDFDALRHAPTRGETAALGAAAARVLERLEATLRDASRGPVRLVAASAVQFQTGWRMPLREMAELCHAHGAELFLDAIQAVGSMPFDARDLDYDYAVAGGHKFLMGLDGAGLVFAKREAQARLVPRLAGWLSHVEPVKFLLDGGGFLRADQPLRATVDIAESGTLASMSCAALGASAAVLRALGPARIFAHVTEHLDRLELGLVERGFRSLRAREPAGRSAILAVVPPSSRGRSVPELAAALAARGVVVGTPDGFLRFSPHFANSLDEIDRVLAAVDAALTSTSG